MTHQFDQLGQSAFGFVGSPSIALPGNNRGHLGIAPLASVIMLVERSAYSAFYVPPSIYRVVIQQFAESYGEVGERGFVEIAFGPRCELLKYPYAIRVTQQLSGREHIRPTIYSVKSMAALII